MLRKSLLVLDGSNIEKNRVEKDSIKMHVNMCVVARVVTLNSKIMFNMTKMKQAGLGYY